MFAATHPGRTAFALVIVACSLVGGCRNPNTALTLPQRAGPVPVVLPRPETKAEHAYWDQLSPARVIYIGETHDKDADHQYQLDVLKGLQAHGTRFAIGWEMFDQTQQELLTSWNQRKLGTDALLEKTDFQNRWGKMSVFYEKILRWSLAEGISSLALNAPPAMSRKLARGEALTAEELTALPTGFRPLPGGYEHFGEQLGGMAHGGGSLENMYKAQLLWDQTMASHVLAHLNDNPDTKLVVLLGRGHVEGGYGVPAFVSQKTAASQLIIFPGGAPTPAPASGSIAWLTAPLPAR